MPDVPDSLGCLGEGRRFRGDTDSIPLSLQPVPDSLGALGSKVGNLDTNEIARRALKYRDEYMAGMVKAEEKDQKWLPKELGWMDLVYLPVEMLAGAGSKDVAKQLQRFTALKARRFFGESFAGSFVPEDVMKSLPSEELYEESMKQEPRMTSGAGMSQIAFGKQLGDLENSIHTLMTGDRQAKLDTIEGMGWDALFIAAFDIAPMTKAGQQAIKWGFNKGIIAPRLLYRGVNRMLPEGKSLPVLRDAAWERIIIPMKTRAIPTREGWKSMHEIWMSRLPELEKVKIGMGSMASPFRNARAKENLLNRAGEDIAGRVVAMPVRDQNEFYRALQIGDLAGETVSSKEVKGVFKEFNKRIRQTGMRPTYEAHFREALEKNFVKHKWKVEPGNLAPGVEKVITKVSDSLSGEFKPKEVRKALKAAIKDPTIPLESRGLCIDLHDLAATTISGVADSARYAARKFMVEGVERMGAVKLTPKDLVDYLPSKMTEFQGMQVLRDVELEMRAWDEIPKIALATRSKWFMTPWKTSKVILRPATHVRNVVSNLILNDWGGLPFYRGDYYWKAYKAMREGKKSWKDWKKLTGGGGSFAREELGHIGSGLEYGATMWDSVLAIFDRIAYVPRKMYDAEEQFFKMAKFIWNTEHKGMKPLAAATDAMKWTFNYGEVTRATALTRQTISPFFTWTSKVMPLMAETAFKHPVRFGKWPLFYMGLQNQAINQLKISDHEWQNIEYILPEYIREGQFLLMPWRDPKGRLEFLNLTYMIPGFGDLNEMMSGPAGLIGDPLISMGGALISKKRYSGAPLYYDWEEGHMKFAKASAYIWEQLMPSWVPGGVDFKKMWETLTNDPDALTWPEMTASSLGFKVTPIDKAKSARRRDAINKIEMQQLGSQMKRDLRGARTYRQREKIVKKYRKLREGIIR